MRLRFWRKPTPKPPGVYSRTAIEKWWKGLMDQNLVPPLTSRVTIEMAVGEPLRIIYGCFADRRVFNDELSNAIAAGSEPDYAI